MHDSAYELPRNPIPRTSVHNGEKEGRGIVAPARSTPPMLHHMPHHPVKLEGNPMRSSPALPRRTKPVLLRMASRTRSSRSKGLRPIHRWSLRGNLHWSCRARRHKMALRRPFGPRSSGRRSRWTLQDHKPQRRICYSPAYTRWGGTS
jgi:hypothetical protein